MPGSLSYLHNAVSQASLAAPLSLPLTTIILLSWLGPWPLLVWTPSSQGDSDPGPVMASPTVATALRLSEAGAASLMW